MRRSAPRTGGVLLVGPVSDGPLVGGIENGIDMILCSTLVEGVRRALGELYHRFDAGPDAVSPASRVESRAALVEACQPARRS